MAAFQPKLEQPQKFEGQMDSEILATFIWQLKNYFALTNIQEGNRKARVAAMLLTKSAAVWLRAREYDLTELSWD